MESWYLGWFQSWCLGPRYSYLQYSHFQRSIQQG